jgi:hypothetical protein
MHMIDEEISWDGRQGGKVEDGADHRFALRGIEKRKRKL